VKRSFLPLFAANFFGVANDNFLKTFASFAVIGWLADERQQAVLMGGVAAALVVPYVVFSPLADRLTALFPKVRIFRLAKWAEFPIVALAVAGFVCQSIPLVVGSVLLMGLQSALYSPAKYALVRDVGGVERISTGMGGMEGIAFAAVLAGTMAASFASDGLPAWGVYAILFALAALGLVATFFIRADEERNRALHAIDPLRYLRRAHRIAKAYPGLNPVIFTLSTFWWAAAMLQMGMLVYGKQVLKLDSTHTGGILCLAAVGIVAGQVIAGFIDRRRFLLAAAPVLGCTGAGLLAVLCFLPLGPGAFAAVLALLAFALGLFKLPFDAEIQKTVKGPRLNTMLAYFNQVSFLFMMGASVCYMAASALFGPRAFLLLLAIALGAVSCAFAFAHRAVLCRAGKWVLGRRYAVTAEGLDDLPRDVPLLFLPNHPALVDPLLVMSELWRFRVRPLVDEQFRARGGLAAHVLGLLDSVDVPDLHRHRGADAVERARGLQRVVVEALEAGGSVIFYPSGHIWTAPCENLGNRQLAHTVCGALPARVRVVAVRTTGLWGSIWSRKGRTASPDFALTLLRAIARWFFVAPFVRRRAVTMRFEDVTDRVRAWSALPRRDFNAKLEAWYNENAPRP